MCLFFSTQVLPLLFRKPLGFLFQLCNAMFQATSNEYRHCWHQQWPQYFNNSCCCCCCCQENQTTISTNPLNWIPVPSHQQWPQPAAFPCDQHRCQQNHHLPRCCSLSLSSLLLLSTKSPSFMSSPTL